MDFKGGWRHTPRSIRWGLVATFIAGVVFAVAGIVLDLCTNLWDRLSLIPNLAASIVGFCIGVPIAFFVIATIVAGREDSERIEKIETLTDEAWREFTTLVKTLFDDKFILVLEVKTPELLHVFRATLSAARRPKSLDDDAAMQALMGRGESAMKTLIIEIHELMHEKAFSELMWASLVSKWRFIDEQVRVRRFEYKLPWLDAFTDAGLTAICSSAKLPFADYYKTFSVGSGLPTPTIQAMDQFMMMFGRLKTLTVDEAMNQIERGSPALVRNADDRHEEAARQALTLARTMRAFADSEFRGQRVNRERLLKFFAEREQFS